MKLKRIITSVSAQFDDLVSKIENHEAVAESAIREARQQTAKIQTQLNVISRRLTGLETRHQTLQQKIDTWKQRAIVSGNDNDDREKALRCVQAMKNAQAESEQVLQQIKETTALKAELQMHLQESEQQVIALQSRKESLVARSAKNNVRKFADSEVQQSDLSSVFDRWEQNLAADEYISTSNHSSEDYLDHEFSKDEKQHELEDELEQLLNPEQKQDSKEANNEH